MIIYNGYIIMNILELHTEWKIYCSRLFKDILLYTRNALGTGMERCSTSEMRKVVRGWRQQVRFIGGVGFEGQAILS